MRPLLLLLALVCCHRDPVDDTDTDTDTDTDADTDADTNSDTADPWWTDERGDADGDGYTEAAGDCDDGDAQVHPGVAVDDCDQVDTDCDGSVDEDFDSDPWEPNDDAGSPLGDLTDHEETLAYGYLFPADDVDRYLFYVEDEDFGWFDIELWLYGVPADADYAIDLYWVEDDSGTDRGLVGTAGDLGPGGYEFINHGGSVGGDDSGWYEARVRSVTGTGCFSPYTLHILVGTW